MNNEEKPKKGGRPTKAEKERQRVAQLLAEGKGADGEPIEDAKVVSETQRANVDAEFTIGELQDNLDDAMLGGGKKEEAQSVSGTNDLRDGDKSSPDYVPKGSHNPFQEELIQNESDANRSYKSANGKGGNSTKQTDFAEPIIEGVESVVDDGTSPVGNSGGGGNSNGAGKKTPPHINPEYDTMTASEKKQQTELFADALLSQYAFLLPLIPSMVCKYSENNVELMDAKGEIRLSMSVNLDGELVSARNIIENFNEDIDKEFAVTQEEKDEIRPLLILILSRRGISPTPEVSLMIIVAQQLLKRIFTSIALRRERNMMLEKFVALKKNEDDNGIQQQKENQFQQQQAQQAPPPPSRHTPQREAPPQPVNSNITVEEIIDDNDFGVSVPSTKDDRVVIEEIVEENNNQDEFGI